MLKHEFELDDELIEVIVGVLSELPPPLPPLPPGVLSGGSNGELRLRFVKGLLGGG